MGTIRDVERGKQLARLRNEAGLTQRDVAGEFGIDKASVSLWEKGGGVELDRIPVLDRLYGAGGAVVALFGLAAPTDTESRIKRLEAQLAAVALLRSQVADLAEGLDVLTRRVADLAAAVERLRRGGRGGAGSSPTPE